MMATAPGGATLAYDPLLRLYETVGGGTTTRFGYDGLNLIAEYDGANTLQRRYVHGPGVDQPLVWYEGAGTATRRWFHADERGSVIAVSDANGDLHGTANRYDEYGVPQGGALTGRFGYTGPGLAARDRPVLLPGEDLQSEPREVHASGSDRLRRRDEPLRLCRRRSGESLRPTGARL
jgi:hypothetical protein